MFFVQRPGETLIRSILAQHVATNFTYATVGCTCGEPAAAPGWNLDRHRVLLGHGEDVFHQARAAIKKWAMFPRAVADVCYPDAPIGDGQVVGVLYWAAPVRLWLLCPARIVYVIDGAKPAVDVGCLERFGFAYGTLPGHPERGEERFLVEWNKADDTVCYDLLAISQPAHWLIRLAYPYARYEQARFRKLSAAAMQAAVRPEATHVLRPA